MYGWINGRYPKCAIVSAVLETAEYAIKSFTYVQEAGFNVSPKRSKKHHSRISYTGDYLYRKQMNRRVVMLWVLNAKLVSMTAGNR